MSLTLRPIKVALPPKVVKFLGGDRQVLSLDWGYIPAMDGTIKSFLVAVRDVTELERLETLQKQHAEKLTMLQEIIPIPRKKLEQFYRSSADYLNICLSKVELGAEELQQDLGVILRSLHTIKGNSRIFKLSQLTEGAHHCESFFQEIQSRKDFSRNTERGKKQSFGPPRGSQTLLAIGQRSHRFGAN